MSNGKGSRPRPMQISRSEFARRWDEAFGRSRIVVNTNVKASIVEALTQSPDMQVIAIPTENTTMDYKVDGTGHRWYVWEWREGKYCSYWKIVKGPFLSKRMAEKEARRLVHNTKHTCNRRLCR
jgi:hypothetical protein